MTDDELEGRIENLFAAVEAPDGVRRWESEPVELPPARAARLAVPRLPSPRRLLGRWAPLALAAAISIAVGLTGLFAGRVHPGGGTSGSDSGAVGTVGQPPARLDPSLAYDPAMHAVVMFGGRTASGQTLDDTWAWDGTTWRQLHPATSPPARSGAGMAWDSATSRLVLVGGMGSLDLHVSTGSTSCTTSSFSQNGSTGISVACSGSAGGYGYAQGCAVPANASTTATCSAVVPPKPIAVPATPTMFTDTWTWDGGDWHAEHPAHGAPAAGPGVQTVSDPAGGVVMVGGFLAPTPAIACVAPPVAPNATPRPAPACATSIPPTPATNAARWTHGDWVSLANIPAFNVRLGVAGNDVLALASGFNYCPGPPIEVPAGASGGGAPASGADATSAAIACPLVGARGATGSGSAASTTVSATATATGKSTSIAEPPPPADRVAVATLRTYVLRGSVWQQQTTSGGPGSLAEVSSFRGALLAVDFSGHAWTGDGRTWHESGSAPLQYLEGNVRLVEDTDRHVVVLVGGYSAASVATLEWDGSAWRLRSGSLPTQPPYPKGVPSILPAPLTPGPPQTVPQPGA